jgi:UDP-glucose 4-epimerase
MKTVIVTGSQGFIGSFLCTQLLDKGYKVIGYDNYSKYGKVTRPHDGRKGFTLVQMDLSGPTSPLFHTWKPDYIIAGAAMIGGISYFHKYAYDLLATNERITANTFDSAIRCVGLNRIVVVSSSMVFEGANDYFDDHTSTSEQGNCCYQSCFDEKEVWPTKEAMIKKFPPPLSTYGFQKLATEYFAKGAWEQYGLKHTIVRPFNCVGVGEGEAKGEEEILSGNVKLMMSHVLPDLINKCLKGQDPLHILGEGNQVRCYTNGRDIARGIITAMESPHAINQDFNISTPHAHTVLELAEMVWKKINPNKPFRYVSDKPFEYDVKRRIPDIQKAKDLLGFEATIPLEQSVDEVIEWMTRSESKQP